MDDLIITSTWDVGWLVQVRSVADVISPQRQQGWRTAKRPGVDYFLAYLSQFYEIVIFTTQHHYVRIIPITTRVDAQNQQTAMPIIEKLDPYNFFITYKLFRESTRSVDGKIVKVTFIIC